MTKRPSHFFVCASEQVRIETRTIVIPTLQNSALMESPMFLTVAELGRLYVLGRHVMELKATLQHSTTEANNIHLCAICCTEHENAQLPCGHGLCETCEARWVARKLTCPFCRARFGSVKTAARQGWNITEFDPEQLEPAETWTRSQRRWCRGWRRRRLR